jgi:hypothetical protein
LCRLLSCIVPPVAVVVPPVALLPLAIIVPPVAIVVSPVALLPLAVIVPPVAVVMPLGGPVDEFPANFFFYSGGILKIRRAKKIRKNKRTTE